jgi:hypothetical protein
MFDGDRNGLCWHLGTAGGSQPWVNPVLAGRLQVGSHDRMQSVLLPRHCMPCRCFLPPD